MDNTEQISDFIFAEALASAVMSILGEPSHKVNFLEYHCSDQLIKC